GADGTSRSSQVLAIGEVGVAVVILDDRRIWSVRREFDGGAVAPAPDELRSQLFLAARIMPPLLIEVITKGSDILVQFPVHHEGTVVAEQVRNRSRRQLAGFIRITQ